MTLRQLLFFHEVVRHGLNVSDAAEALYTAQSGVSKQLHALRDELGVELFRREGKRLIGLTDAGREVEAIAARMLRDAEAIRDIGRAAQKEAAARLTIVSTRYAASTKVRNAVLQFQRQQPRITLRVLEEAPEDACRMVVSGEVQLGVVPEAHVAGKQLRAMLLERWQLAVIVPGGHWLLEQSELTLELLAECPIGCYERSAASRRQVDAAFIQAGLLPPIVFELASSNDILEYVASGACVGILAESAFDASLHPGLRRLPAEHLFPPLTTSIVVSRHGTPSRPASDFIDLLRLGATLKAQREGRAALA